MRTHASLRESRSILTTAPAIAFAAAASFATFRRPEYGWPLSARILVALVILTAPRDCQHSRVKLHRWGWTYASNQSVMLCMIIKKLTALHANFNYSLISGSGWATAVRFSANGPVRTSANSPARPADVFSRNLHGGHAAKSEQSARVVSLLRKGCL